MDEQDKATVQEDTQPEQQPEVMEAYQQFKGENAELLQQLADA